MKLRVASPIEIDSIVDGPGLRMVIWTQGCLHKCRGCHNMQTQSIHGGFDIDVYEIIESMKNIKLQKGITLSGGEPFLQPEPLLYILKEAKGLNLDVWAYSGFTYEELIDKNNSNYKKNIELLKFIDVLVDGKYDEVKRNIRLRFRGSSNQRIIDVIKTLSKNEIVLADEYSDNT